MAKTKKVTVTMTEDIQDIGISDSKKWNLKLLGKDKENLSAYICYLINKAHLEAPK